MTLTTTTTSLQNLLLSSNPYGHLDTTSRRRWLILRTTASFTTRETSQSTFIGLERTLQLHWPTMEMVWTNQLSLTRCVLEAATRETNATLAISDVLDLD